MQVWGDLTMLIRAYRRSRGLFFECLLIPFALWLFAALDMKRPSIPLALSVVGTLLILVGFLLGGMGWSDL